jgi:hypothetical protein
VKWKVNRSWRSSQADRRVLVGVVVVVQVTWTALSAELCASWAWTEADELLMPVALHVAAYDGAVEHLERGEQSRRAVHALDGAAAAVEGRREARLPASAGLGRGRFGTAPVASRYTAKIATAITITVKTAKSKAARPECAESPVCNPVCRR